ncbi:MAG TPA: sugar ABC transporter permease [Bradyrhizobium sp.]|uniref:carbohydrate ABC transporter permease n=1 Tax=Bradyrhizobium sp. TaxID=376 RepID=UPI002CA2146C|nr:sugar ABC transporter permease [Bradyrhizobium sp.]HLZ06092.1 sugar ABC transporter permease [Bradyrhizobium sp.]
MAELASIGSYERGKGTGAAPSARPFWRIGYHTRVNLWGFAFVLPTLIFFAVFKYGPMLWAIALSFTSYDMVSAPQFVGLENYRTLLGDPIFRDTLVNTFVYIAGSTILLTASGLGLALAINTGIPGARHCMMVMFLTNLMPIIAVCLVWRLLLHPFGVVNQILQHFGFGRIDWLTDSATAMPAIIMVTVWRFAPYFMVVFLAALLALPDDYYEAAELDGAGPFRRFFHITLPLLMPTIFFVVVVSALLCARIFLMPFLITGGGPGNATRVLSMLIYETGFSYLKMGEAAAISVVLFAIMLVFTSLQMGLFSRSERIYV